MSQFLTPYIISTRAPNGIPPTNAPSSFDTYTTLPASGAPVKLFASRVTQKRGGNEHDDEDDTQDMRDTVPHVPQQSATPLWPGASSTSLPLSQNAPHLNVLIASSDPSLHLSAVPVESAASMQGITEHHASSFSHTGTFQAEHLAPSSHTASSSTTITSHSNAKEVSIQAKYPLHPSSFVSYYEIRVVALPRNAVTTIGLAKKHYPHNKHPGWQDSSIGYHSDDGNIFLGQGRAAIELDMKFDVGDHVGCGVRWVQRGAPRTCASTQSEPPTEPHLEAFFTRNGKIVVDGIKRSFDNIYPTVGLNRATVNIIFNPQAFMFNPQLEQMEWAELIRAQQHINSIHIEQRVLRKIVRDYLIHEGYVETLQAFDKSTTNDAAGAGDVIFFSEEEKTKLSQRNSISNLIAQGKILAAMQTIQKSFPSLFAQFPYTEQILQYQLFIEYIREGNVVEALQLLRGTLSKYHSNIGASSFLGATAAGSIFRTVTSSPERFNETVSSNDLLPPIHQVAGLIAYTDPSSSPLKALLHQNRRELIADVVKRQLKVAMGFSKSEKEDYSVIERLMSQLLLTFSKAFSPTSEHEENDSEKGRRTSFAPDPSLESSSRPRRRSGFTVG